jgi:uncharacterized protein YegL
MAITRMNPSDRNTVDTYLPAADEKYPGETKVLVSLVLDTSASMTGRPIDELNRGVQMFLEEVRNDSQAGRSVEIEVIAFGDDSVRVVSGLNLVEDISFKALGTSGNTPMGEAILYALSRLETRKEKGRANGIRFWRPWIVLITDGYPTDMELGDQKWTEVEHAVRHQEQGKHVICYAFGTETADFGALSDLFENVYKISEADFRDVFQWLSDSLSVVSGAADATTRTLLKAPDGTNATEVIGD